MSFRLPLRSLWVEDHDPQFAKYLGLLAQAVRDSQVAWGVRLCLCNRDALPLDEDSLYSFLGKHPTIQSCRCREPLLPLAELDVEGIDWVIVRRRSVEGVRHALDNHRIFMVLMDVRLPGRDPQDERIVAGGPTTPGAGGANARAYDGYPYTPDVGQGEQLVELLISHGMVPAESGRQERVWVEDLLRATAAYSGQRVSARIGSSVRCHLDLEAPRFQREVVSFLDECQELYLDRHHQLRRWVAEWGRAYGVAPEDGPVFNDDMWTFLLRGRRPLGGEFASVVGPHYPDLVEQRISPWRILTDYMRGQAERESENQRGASVDHSDDPDWIYRDRTGNLRRGERVLPLVGQRKQLLEYFLENHHRWLKRDDIVQVVLPHKFKNRAKKQLHTLLYQLRNVLDENQGSKYIRNLGGRGAKSGEVGFCDRGRCPQEFLLTEPPYCHELP